METMPRKILTRDQIADAMRFKHIWNNKKTLLNLNQEKVCEHMGWSSQSSFSQYLNGKIALNLKAVVKLAKILEVPPEDISPTLTKDLARNIGLPIEQSRGGYTSTTSTRVLDQLRALVERGQLTDDNMVLLGEMARQMQKDSTP